MAKRRSSRKVPSKVNNDMGWSGGNSMLSGIFDGAPFGGAPLSSPYNLGYDNQYNPLSLNRILLSYAYMTHGVIQTAIDQPVEDAFRGGLIIKCTEMDEEDINLLQDYLRECDVLKAVKDAMKWAKLYGGAGIIINTDQDPKEELDIKAIGPKTPLSFISADRWELTLNYIQAEKIPCPYNYYGQSIHKTRVIKVMGKEAPAYIRLRLQGWGMSELERMIRDLNQYVKNQDLIYQLLDEAKIDVWHIEGFNTALMSQKSQTAVKNRLQLANILKNYHSAIVMDKNDEYEQKQLTFTGLSDMLNQIRIGIASSLRMPMTKVFGLSASGFNSGEDDIENYNALIESEVREKAREVLTAILPLCCQQIFGYMPEGLKFEFKPLRVLSAEQEENVKTIKFNRLSALYSQGLLTAKEYDEELRQNNIISVETEISTGAKEDATPPITPEPSSTFDVPQKMIKEKVPKE